MKLKIKLLKNKLNYYVYCIIILTLAYFLNRFYQMLMFILLFDFIQNCFSDRFHAESIVIDNPLKAVKLCKIITVIIEVLYLIFCKEINISIYSNLFIIFVIALSNSLLQYFIIREFKVVDKLSDLDELLILCKEANLTEVATNRMIMKYVKKKTYAQIAQLEFVEVETIKQSIIRSRKKLNIK